jgi:hypothetical protein
VQHLQRAVHAADDDVGHAVAGDVTEGGRAQLLVDGTLRVEAVVPAQGLELLGELGGGVDRGDPDDGGDARHEDERETGTAHPGQSTRSSGI